MHKTSVTFPVFDWQRTGMPIADDMACKGLTAQMHHKFIGGVEGRSQSRRKESSLMPPITPRKLSASSHSSSSTKDQDGSAKHKNRKISEETNMPNFDVYEETGYLEIEHLSNRGMTEKLGNKGHKLYTLHETKKLPEILKPKGESSDHSTRKRKGQVKQGKKKADGNSTSGSGIQDAEISTTVTEEGSEQRRPDNFSELYGDNWKRRLEWNMTRPFTFSYFPQIHQKRKKKDAEMANSRAKKLQGKGVATPHLNKY